MRSLWKGLWRIVGWCVLAGVLLQVFFVARIAIMAWVDPQSTTFQRTDMAQQLLAQKWSWQQRWVPYARISDHLKRAVIASEDSGFLQHQGIDWDALDSARERNAKAQARAQAKQAKIEQQHKKKQEQAQKRVARLEKAGKPVSESLLAAASGASAPETVQAKVVGASTVTQQLAKNLFLSGERTLFRKAQEFLLTQYLELLLGKRRILEIYLNNVEWGEGIYGAEAAAQYYFKKPAARLSEREAARLAVMLPRPKYFQQQQGSSYLSSRSATIAARMRGVAIP